VSQRLNLFLILVILVELPMNEWIFFTHLLLLIAFLFAALRAGKMGLTVLVCLLTVVANIFVVKQISLFGLSVTCSDVYIVGGLLALNLLQEFFGKESALKAVRISFMAATFFVAMVEMHLWYVPNAADVTQSAFLQIFSATPRIVAASLAVFFLVQQMDLRVFAWLQNKWGRRYLPFRVGVSLLLSQIVDTVLFSFLGLYGIVASVMAVIVVSLPVKFLSIACSAPFTAFCRRFVKIKDVV
jgi:queuosine precursor transporter